MKALPVLFCSLLMFVNTAFAKEAIVPEQESVPYYKDYKRGWFWYEQKAPEKPQEEQKAPENPKEQKHRIPSLKDYTAEQLWDMYPDDFQALLTDFQKRAVWRPTTENVEEYYYAQDIARRKALAFTNVAEYVMQKDPELSLSKDYPTVVPGQNALVRSREGEVKERIMQAKADYGLLYFYSHVRVLRGAGADHAVLRRPVRLGDQADRFHPGAGPCRQVRHNHCPYHSSRLPE